MSDQTSEEQLAAILWDARKRVFGYGPNALGFDDLSNRIRGQYLQYATEVAKLLDQDRATEAARLNTQRDAVLALIGEAQNLAAADVQAGGPRDQLDDLTIPVHDLLVAVGVVAPEQKETGGG